MEGMPTGKLPPSGSHTLPTSEIGVVAMVMTSLLLHDQYTHHSKTPVVWMRDPPHSPFGRLPPCSHTSPTSAVSETRLPSIEVNSTLGGVEEKAESTRKEGCTRRQARLEGWEEGEEEEGREETGRRGDGRGIG